MSFFHSGVAFKNFGTRGHYEASFAVGTNPQNEDLQHPITVSGIIMEDVERGYEVVYHRPSTA